MVSAQLFALRTYSIAKAKMVTNAGARKAEDQLRDAIRSASSVYIGKYTSFSTNFSSGSFPSISSGLFQGNAIEIFPTTNSTPYIICRVNTTTGELQYYDSNLTNAQVLARNIINKTNFFSESYQGTVFSNNAANSTIRMTLIFDQNVYSTSQGNVNDYYQITMRATVR